MYVNAYIYTYLYIYLDMYLLYAYMCYTHVHFNRFMHMCVIGLDMNLFTSIFMLI